MYYVIQTQTGKEQKTIEEINDRVNTSFAYEAFMPLFVQLKKIKGEWKEVVKPYFPGYIFVEVDKEAYVKEIFKQLTYVPSFTKLLGRQGLSDIFEPLNDIEERTINILCSKHMDRVTKLSSVQVKEGMKIQVLDGPLLGQESIIRKVNLHKRTVTISISVGGRENLVDLGIDIVSEMI